MKVNLQLATQAQNIPTATQFKHWVKAALPVSNANVEVTIRVVDEQEMSELNEKYRHRQGTTNVLAFPFEAPPGVTTALLGDIVICAAVANEEAAAQNKMLNEHWAHLIIHGVLHLLGYNHKTSTDAKTMEGLEIEILAKLGFSNPY